MEQITKQIEEAIKNHLPQQVGEVLQKQLAELPRLSSKIVALEAELKTVNEKAKVNEIAARDAQAELNKHVELNIRERRIEQREHTLEIELLKKDIQCRDLQLSSIKEVVNTVFKNPVYQEQHFVSKSLPVVQNGCVSQQMESNNTTVSKGVA